MIEKKYSELYKESWYSKQMNSKLFEEVKYLQSQMEKFISLQKNASKSKSWTKRKMSNKVDKHIKVKLRGSKEGSQIFEKENANYS